MIIYYRRLLLPCIAALSVSAVHAQTSDEQVFWDAVKGCTVADEVKAYLGSYPDGHFKSEAKACLAILSPDPVAIESALNLSREDRRLIQHALNARHLNAGTPDGVFGVGTRSAIKRYQKNASTDDAGYLDSATAKMLIAEGRPLAKAALAAEKRKQQEAAARAETVRKRQEAAQADQDRKQQEAMRAERKRERQQSIRAELEVAQQSAARKIEKIKMTVEKSLRKPGGLNTETCRKVLNEIQRFRKLAGYATYDHNITIEDDGWLVEQKLRIQKERLEKGAWDFERLHDAKC